VEVATLVHQSSGEAPPASVLVLWLRNALSRDLADFQLELIHPGDGVPGGARSVIDKVAWCRIHTCGGATHDAAASPIRCGPASHSGRLNSHRAELEQIVNRGAHVG